MNIHPLIKINFAALIVLFFALLFTYNVFFKEPSSEPRGIFKNKNVQKTFIFLVRTFFVLALIGCIIFINIPILRDTFSHQKPITLTGKVESATHGLFFVFSYWFHQSFTISNVDLNIVFYPKIIIKDKTYKVTYLPHSKAVLTIERLD